MPRPHQKSLSPCRRSSPPAYQDPQGTQGTLTAKCNQYFKAILCNAIQWSLYNQSQYFPSNLEMGGGKGALLKWEDFQENVKASFKGLREDEDFADVTLACEDGEVKAHKVILSSCSPIFERLLKRNKHHQHQVVFMRGLKTSQLVALVDYIYQGELKILQDELDPFLILAQELQLRGLLAGFGKAEANNRSVSEEGLLPCESLKEEGSQKNTRGLSDENKEIILPGLDLEDEKESQKAQIHKAVTDLNNSEMDEYVNNMVEEELKKMPKLHPDKIYLKNVQQKTRQKTKTMYEQWFQGMWGCNICGYTSSFKNSLKKHVEKHIEGSAYPCSRCGKSLKTTESLRLHYMRSHPVGSQQ